MKALILNSGMGTRMGEETTTHPKCMTEISYMETIVSRQLRMLYEVGITEIVMTTGAFDDTLINYCNSLELPLHITYIKNPDYMSTNYIYSIYCAKEYLNDDLILLHGDLIFENSVLDSLLSIKGSGMVISSTVELPEKDFKAQIVNGKINKIGIELFGDSFAAQPLYKLLYEDWMKWLNRIILFCESGNRKCYAENAFNEVSNACNVYPLDVGEKLCCEVDTMQDLEVAKRKLQLVNDKTVYMCFSTDILHGGHIAIISKAARLGKVIIGVLSDEAVMSYKRFPLLPFVERKKIFENIKGVYNVVEQKTLSYVENIEKYKPTYVVHGDDWKTGFQKKIRDEVVCKLQEYGGQLVEFPYSNDDKYIELEKRARKDLSLPDVRRARLKKAIELKETVTAIEAHSGITGLIAENTIVYDEGKAYQFDAMWISSLCDSTVKGKPDIELVDMSSRFRTIDDIMEVTTKPIIFDGDTGGLVEHFIYTVRTLERMGVSMVIIEDKTGLKKNSLFGNEVIQHQESVEKFCEKISAGKRAKKTNDFMICARIESLILEQGMEDALSRARAYVGSGADAIMIHSRKKDPDEIFEFVDKFRNDDEVTPLVVVPTTFNSVTEAEFKRRGVNIVIYANQLTRSGFPAMQNAAKTILLHHRALECDEMCMPIKQILSLIPEEE